MTNPMTPLEMIAEWRDEGCRPNNVLKLIDELERSLSTESKEEGPRYRLERIAVKTTWNYVGQVDQLIESPTGIMQRRVLNTMESQTRAALIAQGWTPPRSKT